MVLALVPSENGEKNIVDELSKLASTAVILFAAIVYTICGWGFNLVLLLFGTGSS